MGGTYGSPPTDHQQLGSPSALPSALGMEGHRFGAKAPQKVRTPRRTSAGEGDQGYVGDVGDDGIHAQGGELADAVGVVAGPRVDGQALVVGHTHDLLGPERAVGVDGYVAMFGRAEEHKS